MRFQNGNLLFSLFGFPVTVNWVFWIVAALLGGAIGANSPDAFKFVLIWVAVVFVSILWHELGHAFFQRRFGGRPSILLYGFGGLAQSEGRFSRRQSLVISAAGPCASLLFGLVTLGFVVANGWAAKVWLISIRGEVPSNIFLIVLYQSLLQVNIFWAFLNLLPVQPLDGGHILSALAGGRMSNRTIAIIGGVAAGGVAIVALLYRQFFIAVLFGYLAYTNYQRANNVHRGFW
ncbi:MAG: M50 family metallopeptidase [Verrucomicrobiota bacterium]